MSDERETDYVVDWQNYPRLGQAIRGYETSELRQLLRDARADAVRFIKDASAEELRKAFDRGFERGLAEGPKRQGSGA